MTVVGGSYQYDLFFSYAWAEKTGGAVLRDWSRMVADKITQLVRIRFSELAPYLDRDVNKHTAIQLDASLQKAAENAAIFVAMISPYYKSEYCQKELNWFLDRSTSEGATVTERMCLYLVQDGDDLLWPDKLREPSGSRLLYKPFYGEGGLPLDIAAFINGAPTPLLTQPILDAVLEIGNKIKEIKDKLQARLNYEDSQRPPVNPVVFLEAEVEDELRWTERRGELKRAANIVLPAKAPPTPATAVRDPGATYAECDGMVLLRSRANDDIGSRIKRAYLDRRQLYRDGKKMVPWVLLDEIDDPPPESEEFDLPRVVTRGEWVPELQHKLLGV